MKFFKIIRSFINISNFLEKLYNFLFNITKKWENMPKKCFKAEKYAPLIADLSQRYVVSFFPIEVSARGQVSKDNRTRLKTFLYKCCAAPRTITKSAICVSSKAALLSSYSIFIARGEPTWEDPPPLMVS